MLLRRSLRDRRTRIWEECYFLTLRIGHTWNQVPREESSHSLCVDGASPHKKMGGGELG